MHKLAAFQRGFLVAMQHSQAWSRLAIVDLDFLINSGASSIKHYRFVVYGRCADLAVSQCLSYCQSQTAWTNTLAYYGIPTSRICDCAIANSGLPGPSVRNLNIYELYFSVSSQIIYRCLSWSGSPTLSQATLSITALCIMTPAYRNSA